MVLPFQDDNLSIEYSQFRQDGLLKKKKGTKWLCDSFLFKYQILFFLFFSKNNTYRCYMVGKDVFVFWKKEIKCFWVLFSNSLASKGGGTRRRKENFVSFCVCDVNITTITLTRAKNGTRWPAITCCLFELFFKRIFNIPRLDYGKYEVHHISFKFTTRFKELVSAVNFIIEEPRVGST